MKVLVACEFSGVVRDAFIRQGHEATSCDLIPTEAPGPHYAGPVEDILRDGWDLMIAHPPCTYLAASGMHWTTRGLRDPQLTETALEFVRKLMAAPIRRIAIENPVGVISTRIRKPDQIIQPWHFGHDASKKTCLWLKHLPPLKPTQIIPASSLVLGRQRWANQTTLGRDRCSAKGEERMKIRSVTYSGVAEAMATQWGALN